MTFVPVKTLEEVLRVALPAPVALTIAFYISGHGLGHASRDVELIDEILRRRGDVRIVVRTSAAPWIFDRIRGPRVEVQRCETDTGVVQLDSLRLDIEETARGAAAFYRDFDRRVDRRGAHLRQLGARLVIGDVPPLAFAAAQAAGLPSVLVANFTWDWIYAYYPEFEALAPGVVDTIAAAYSSAAKALRLPIHGGFDSVGGGHRGRAVHRAPIDPRSRRHATRARASAAASVSCCRRSADTAWRCPTIASRSRD